MQRCRLSTYVNVTTSVSDAVTVTGQKATLDMVKGGIEISVFELYVVPSELERIEVTKGSQTTCLGVASGLGGKINVHGGAQTISGLSWSQILRSG